MPPGVILRSARVSQPSATGPAAIHIHRGKITAVTAHDDVPPDAEIVDAGNLVIMPGLVDTHVHINEPGRTHWEGFHAATRAAAAGGVTTLVDMPLNSIPATTTLAGLRAKLAAARQQCWTDVAFWGGVVPGNVRDLLALHEAGVRGFKCFLAPSGVAEFPHVQERDLRQAMPALTEIGAPLLVHAELPDLLNSDGGDPVRYRDYLQTRPPAAEEEAIALMIRLCREFRTRVHIVHLASSGALAMLRAAKDEGLPITVETCPHYLHFAAETIPDRATEFKCAPPIREGQHGEALWSALTSGLIDFIATDHSPCPPELKLPESGDFLRAWGGIASLGLALPVIWTGARRRGLGLEDVARWLSTAPARLARLDHKGMIAAGYDADFVIWAPEAALEVRNYHRLTPYNGQQLSGVVQSTWLHGRRIFDRGRLVLEPPGTTCTN